MYYQSLGTARRLGFDSVLLLIKFNTALAKESAGWERNVTSCADRGFCGRLFTLSLEMNVQNVITCV